MSLGLPKTCRCFWPGSLRRGYVLPFGKRVSPFKWVQISSTGTGETAVLFTEKERA